MSINTDSIAWGLFLSFPVSIVVNIISSYIPSWFSKYSEVMNAKTIRKMRKEVEIIRTYIEQPQKFNSFLSITLIKIIFILAIIGSIVVLFNLSLHLYQSFFTEYSIGNYNDFMKKYLEDVTELIQLMFGSEDSNLLDFINKYKNLMDEFVNNTNALMDQEKRFLTIVDTISGIIQFIFLVGSVLIINLCRDVFLKYKRLNNFERFERQVRDLN